MNDGIIIHRLEVRKKLFSDKIRTLDLSKELPSFPSLSLSHAAFLKALVFLTVVPTARAFLVTSAMVDLEVAIKQLLQDES